MLNRASSLPRCLAVAGLVLLGTVIPARGDPTGLVLRAPSLIGFHAVPDSRTAARADLGAGLPRALRGLVARADAQSSEQAGEGQVVRSDALTFGSARAARRVLAAWRRAHRARALRLGRNGSISVHRSGGLTTVLVAWREGSRAGEIVLRARRGVAGPATLAVAYARLADSRLLTPVPPTAWGRALAEIGPDGSTSKQTALDLFALAFTRIPGAHPPTGARAEIDSGTLAADTILRYRRALSARQLAIVDHALGVPPPGRSARADASEPGFTPDPKVQSVVDGFVDAYRTKLGGYPLALQVIAGKTSIQFYPSGGGKPAFAHAIVLNDSGGTDSGQKKMCLVEVDPAGLAETPEKLGLDLAHETFHCFEFALEGLTNWAGRPAWIEEGMADWAALSVDPVAFNVGGKSLEDYLGSPGVRLFSRSYSSSGFWGHAQDVTGSLWVRIPTILSDTTDEASFADAGGATDDFLDSWGSSVVRSSEGGSPWQMVSPVTPPNSVPAAITGTIAGSGFVQADPYTTALYALDSEPSAPLEHVVLLGHARLSTQHNYVGLDDKWFCTSSEPCECPKDTEGQVPENEPLESHAMLALSGGPERGTDGTITAVPLEEFCKPKNNGNGNGNGGGLGGPLTCPSGCGAVQGDPHMYTIDGAPYDFQAAGEFTVAKSTTDGLEIQERQQPVDVVYRTHGSLASMVTAVAMRVGRATVEFDDVAGPIAVRLDKHLVRLRQRRVAALAGGGELARIGDVFAVLWPDHTQAQVFVSGGDGVSFVLQPARARFGKLGGLLGKFDGDPADDFTSRGGHRYVPVLTNTGASPLPYKVLYKRFGDSWRITQRRSLFFYPPGESTRTFTLRGFPGQIQTLGGLPRRKRAAGRRACHRVHNLVVARSCVFDVAVTGDPRYGAGAGKVEQVAPTVGKKVSLPGGPGVSPWVELSSRGDPETPPVPALAPAGDGRGFVAAYERARAGGVEVASFTAGPGGVAGPSRVQAVSGWSLVGDPVLFPAAGGGLQMLFQGIRSTNPGDPLDGTILVRRNDDGSFGNPVLASSSYRGLGSEAVLASDLTTPIFSTTQSGLVVNYGGSNATAIDLSRYSQGAPYGSAIAYDNTRRLWLAWYADGGSTPARAGLYMLQLDPATGEPVSGVSAAHAPASANVNFAERLALACASSCRLVYEDGTRLLSWAPGESSPATVAYGVNVLSSPAAAYTSDGRLWVVWVDGSVLYAKLGDARGVRGLTAQLGSPPGGSQPRESAIVPAGNALVVATAWSTGTQTVWAATVRR